jgi:5'-nucleotidase
MMTRFSPLPLLAALVLAGCASIAPAQPAITSPATVAVRLLALNDLHGQLPPGRRLDGRPVGGAPVLAAWLRDAERGAEGNTLIVDAGDMVGASPLTSWRLRDEPTVLFLNQLANSQCSAADRMAPDCNMVGTLGNHEFDKGLQELLRLNLGGPRNDHQQALAEPWLGESFPLVSANVVWADTGKPVLAPYVVKQVSYRDARTGQAAKLPIAFIGATVKGTPWLTSPAAVEKLRFLDEADAVNHYLPEIRAKGIHAVVLLIHQGGSQPPYPGITDTAKPPLAGPIVDIVKRLDDDVAVVVSGHSHAFSNAMLPNASGKPVLVTQAFSYSAAFAKIDLTLDDATDTVISKHAEIMPAYADSGPGLHPDPQAAALLAKAEALVGPTVNRLVARIRQDIDRQQDRNGESALGNLVADAQRAAAHTDFAFMNRGGLRDELRADAHRDDPALPAGAITYRDLYAVQPFDNTLMQMTLTGEQIYALLEQEFTADRVHDGSVTPQLYVSGLSYDWSLEHAGSKVVEIRQHGQPINRAKGYSVVVNRFLADGGDGFSVFRQGSGRTSVGNDVEALEHYLKAMADRNSGFALAPPLGTRIRRLDN